MLGRLHTIVLGAAVAVLSVACGAPSSFDGLSGGSKEDAALIAPRPMSPLSVTMVSTNRPRMKWELFGTSTGAVVELCKTRDFAEGTVKRFEADGRELVIPEDLEPGIWFWRLTGRGKGTVGTLKSTVWEVLVRGPAARGASDVPFGSVADLDGDGRPELIIGGDVPVPGIKTLDAELLVYPSTSDGLLATDNPQEHWIPNPFDAKNRTETLRDLHPNNVGAGIDYDGDGYADMAYTYLGMLDPNGLEWFGVIAEGGGKYDPSSGKFYDLQTSIYPGSSPSLSEAGDLNGDGYGDLVVADWASPHLVLGGAKGPNANISFDWMTAIAGPGSAARAVRSGFDIDGDGLADLAFGPASPVPTATATKALVTGASVTGKEAIPPADTANEEAEPRTAGFVLGSDTRGYGAKYLSSAGTDVAAKAFASGDFDGDSVPDLAVVAPVNGTLSVCVWYGSREKGFSPGPCTSGLAGDKEIGTGITAADLEGDGKDEILVTVRKEAASEIRVLHFSDAGVDVQPIGERGYGTRLTTVWPGRPGKARWAALADDGMTVAVYEAGNVSQTITRPSFVRDNFGRALR